MRSDFNPNTHLPVMERFYTVQGEGHFAGSPAFFIRLAGCDVGCVWCDVKESWDAEVHPLLSIEAMVEEVKVSGAPMVVVTGGEPTLYDLTALTNALKEIGVRTHIETSGTNELTGVWDWVTFSPKKFRAPVSSIYAQANELKVIVYHPSDLSWAEDHAKKIQSDCIMFLQAEWDKRDTMYPLIMGRLREEPKWRISVQTHKYLGVD